MLAFLLPTTFKDNQRCRCKRFRRMRNSVRKMVEICLVILAKAVKLTKTDMDDQLLRLSQRQSRAKTVETGLQGLLFYKYL